MSDPPLTLMICTARSALVYEIAKYIGTNEHIDPLLDNSAFYINWVQSECRARERGEAIPAMDVRVHNLPICAGKNKSRNCVYREYCIELLSPNSIRC